MAEKTLTCTFFVGGVPVDKITPEQAGRMAQKVGEVLSIYYTAHPEEYAMLKENKVTRRTKNEKIYSED